MARYEPLNPPPELRSWNLRVPSFDGIGLRDMKGSIGIKGFNGVRASLEALLASYKQGPIDGAITIDNEHSYWWVLEYGSGKFFGEKGKPEGILDSPGSIFERMASIRALRGPQNRQARFEAAKQRKKTQWQPRYERAQRYRHMRKEYRRIHGIVVPIRLP